MIRPEVKPKKAEADIFTLFIVLPNEFQTSIFPTIVAHGPAIDLPDYAFIVRFGSLI